MPNTKRRTTVPTPPTPVTVPPDRWIARRFGLPPAVAVVVAELAFAPSATWVGAQR